MSFTRREFIKTGAGAALGLSLMHLRFAEAADSAAILAREYAYADWHDIYRQQWKWDKVARSTHFVNCWYQAHCAWNVYVKDGIVWREEQVGEYPQTAAGLPDFNPRGCQKGACYSHRMYDASRLKYPLKRAGERGEGKWKRVSWDEALTEIADKVIDAMSAEGTDRVVWSPGPLLTMGVMAAGMCRLAVLMGNPILDMNTEIGDGHHGAAVTFGKIIAERSADDYFNSELILIWGCNPLYTQIPNAHFLTEARYNGSRVITITPDYSASAVHADLWVPVKPGTDSALALSIAQVIIAENLHNRDFLVEQTDMPILVRDDTHRLLRESDIRQGGSEERFYVFDQNSKAPKQLPDSTLKLGNIAPALEGSFEVDTLKGKVKVRTVFELLKEKLAKEYTPEQTAKTTAVSPAMVRRLAHEIGKAKTAANVTSSNWGKFYHGSLSEIADPGARAVRAHGQERRRLQRIPLPGQRWIRRVHRGAAARSRHPARGRDARASRRFDEARIHRGNGGLRVRPRGREARSPILVRNAVLAGPRRDRGTVRDREKLGPVPETDPQ